MGSIILTGGYYHYVTTSNLKSDLVISNNVQAALTDTIKTYLNKNNQLVNEKLTLQADLKDLTSFNIILTNNQKQLLNTISGLSKEREIITAALIETQAELEGLKNNQPIISDSSIAFKANTDSLIYDIEVSNVIPMQFLAKSKNSYFKHNRTINCIWSRINNRNNINKLINGRIEF